MTLLLRGSLGIALALLALSLFASPAHAATTVSGNILDGTVWTVANSPYVVSGARVPLGSTLTIEPGVVVKMALGRGLPVDGTLIAHGTAEEPIYFTSIKDDTVGEDTNGDGTLTSPAALDWQQIQIFQTAHAEISHAVIRYGGLRSPATGLSNCGVGIRHCFGALMNAGELYLADSKFYGNNDHAVYQVSGTSTIERIHVDHGATMTSAVQVSGGELSLSESVLRGSRRGVVADDGTVTLTLFGNIFEDTSTSVGLVHPSVDFVHGNNSAPTGALRGFEVSGALNGEKVWMQDTIPYVVRANVLVSQDSGLTIEPGVVVKFADDQGFTVEGSLTVRGSEEEKIYFTSVHDDEVAGDTNGNGAATSPAHQDWQQIRIFENGEASINHAVVRYGGLPQPPSGLSNCSPTLRHCRGALTNIGILNLANSEFVDNYEYDVYQTNGSSTIEKSFFEHATNIGPSISVLGGVASIRDSVIRGGRHNVSADLGAQQLILENNTFIDSGVSTARIDGSVDFAHSNNHVDGGAIQGFVISRSITGEKIWTKDALPYVIETQNVNIPVGTTLTIEPGVVIKFNNAGLVVDGSLIAHGSEEEKIYFTSLHDDTISGDTNGNGSTTAPAGGNWEQIRVFNTGNASISNAVLRYGGDPYRPGLNNCGDGIRICYGVISNVGTLTLADSALTNNASYTLYQTGGSSTMDRLNIVGHNLSPHMRVEGGAMQIRNSAFSQSSYYSAGHRAIDASNALETVDARDNWWDDPTGPYNATLNPGGLGAGASGNVIFTPWLGADPFAEEPEPEIDPLILQYEPILYFHEDEDFYPMNVEPFVESSALWSTDGFGDTQLQSEGSVTTATISGPDTEDWYLAFSTPDQAKSFDPAIAKQKYDQLEADGLAVPTYYAHMMEQGGYIVLQYWYFYAFNSWKEHGGFNNHEGDWESVFVFLDVNTKKPEYVAFSAHHDDGEPNPILGQFGSVRRSWEQIQESADNNPISFVALGSHANYSSNGDNGIHHTRTLDDQTSMGGVKTSNLYWMERKIIDGNFPDWMSYAGQWGADRNDLLDGESGPLGPKYNNVSGTERFSEPVKWAGLDKISTHSGDGSASELAFENQTTKMSFTDPVPLGETVTSDQHDELITFGNLDAVNLMPRFWDFSTSLPNGSFEVDVELGYTDEEVEALGLSEEKLSAFLYDEENSVWNPVASLVDALANTISFKTTHFSRYAIGQLVVTNEPPVLDPIGDQTVGEGDTLEFTISATDPDEGDTLTYAAANLPEGASFDPATRTFYWNTDYDDAGNYTDIEFTVTDDGEPLGLDVELITITVGDVNRAPVFENPGPQEILEDERLDMVIGAFDPDGDEVELAALNLPERASFSTSTGEFSWKPTRSQEGVYVLTFVASDDGEPQASSTLDIVITVGDNPTPIELAEQLIALVLSYQLPQEIENSYLANLKKVPTFIEEGKIAPAAQQLEAFVQKVEMDYRKGKIDAETKSFLADSAKDLLAGLDTN